MPSVRKDPLEIAAAKSSSRCTTSASASKSSAVISVSSSIVRRAAFVSTRCVSTPPTERRACSVMYPYTLPLAPLIPTTIRRIDATVTRRVQGRLAESLNGITVLADSTALRAFAESAVRWCRTGAPPALVAMLRSPCSGVPHDVAAAYATLATRTGSLLAAIDAQRLGITPSEREATLTFATRARRVAALPNSTTHRCARPSSKRSSSSVRSARTRNQTPAARSNLQTPSSGSRRRG